MHTVIEKSASCGKTKQLECFSFITECLESVLCYAWLADGQFINKEKDAVETDISLIL